MKPACRSRSGPGTGSGSATTVPASNGYGIPGLRGTYYWSVDVDPKIKLDGPFFQEIGLHSQIRLRENGTFRPFIEDQVWPWEAYAYAKTTAGTFKAGQIWKRFGLDWDGVFYGNVAYFDGFKLDPDLGVSWEYTFKVSDAFKVDTIAQFYFREDGINGSLDGADAESTSLLREENTGVVRVVPTWTFADGSSIALGLSGSVGQIDARGTGVSDDTHSAWAVDLTYTKGNFKVFGEVAPKLRNHPPDALCLRRPQRQDHRLPRRRELQDRTSDMAGELFPRL